MLPRHHHVTRFSDGLTHLSAIVKARSSNNLNDASHILETIVRLVLNAQYGWKLVNLNTVSKNYPTADLADHEAGVVVQVTVQASARKVAHTLEKAAKHGLPDGINRLVLFFFITKAPSLPKKLRIPENIEFEVWDIPGVVAHASDIDDLPQLQRLVAVLENEIGQVEAPTESGSEPKLFARFQEFSGKLGRVPERKTKLSSYAMDLWIEDAPDTTEQVAFEILDEEVEDRDWTIKKNKASVRQFLTDEMNLYGDVEIRARGMSGSATDWITKSSLHDALLRYYGDGPLRKDIQTALRQIKNN